MNDTTSGGPHNTQSGLQTGSLHWIKVAALGIAIAISGSFSGWNYGLAFGGWGGMFIASLAMALLFFCLTQCVAELAAAMPNQAGFDSYVRVALGPAGGFIAGMAVAVGLAIGAGLATSFAAAYCQGLFGFGGWPVKIGLFVIVIALQLRGVSEAVGFTGIVGSIAVVVLILFCVVAAPQFSAANLLSNTEGGGAALLRGGIAGTFQCVPFALFLFMGVEQAAQAAAEIKDVSRSMPKALLAAIVVVFVIGVGILLLATGAGGVQRLAAVDDPLLAAVTVEPGAAHVTVLSRFIAAGALTSLVATFFSLTYAASRQFYHLAAGGGLPKWLMHTNRRGSPAAALALVAVLGVPAAAFKPDTVMVVFIFFLAISYALILLSFLKARRATALLSRPYRAIGGVAAGLIGMALIAVVLASCFATLANIT